MPFTAQITVDIRPIEVDGKHFVSVKLDDHERQRGPFADAAAAQAVADKLIARWQSRAAAPPTVPDTIMLHGKPTTLESDLGRKFTVDAVRAAEGLITDNDLKEKYGLTAKNLKEIAKNKKLIEAIRDERMRRMRNGSAARESASRHFVRAPNIMGAIMDDAQANPRHRIEAAREIRATATGGGEENAPNAGEMFHIVINLGADEKFEKEVKIAPKPPQVIESKPDAE